MSQCHVRRALVMVISLILVVPLCKAQAVGSISAVVVAQRDGSSGDRELVVAVPSTWDGQPIDGSLYYGPSFHPEGEVSPRAAKTFTRWIRISSPEDSWMSESFSVQSFHQHRLWESEQ